MVLCTSHNQKINDQFFKTVHSILLVVLILPWSFLSKLSVFPLKSFFFVILKYVICVHVRKIQKAQSVHRQKVSFPPTKFLSFGHPLLPVSFLDMFYEYTSIRFTFISPLHKWLNMYITCIVYGLTTYVGFGSISPNQNI